LVIKNKYIKMHGNIYVNYCTSTKVKQISVFINFVGRQ